MINSIMVVCVGNICRSPLGEQMLRKALPNMVISSAGIDAVVGALADPTGAKAAAEIGVDLGGHVARQLTYEIASAHDLILVMEPGHREEISRSFPQLSGRTLLFDYWSGGRGIADPYRHPIEDHRAARDLIAPAADAWVARLRKPAL